MSAQVPPTRSPKGPTVPLHGAVDLAAVAAAREAQKAAEERARKRVAAGPDAALSDLVFDTTDATFQTDVLERSFQVPVVLDLWADWCGPCKLLSPILEKMAEADGGTWVLAKVDVDAEPEISAAFQVQSIPTVIAFIKGQPLPLFQGALHEAQVRQYINELIKVAAQLGVTGSAPGEAAANGRSPAGAQAAEPEHLEAEPAEAGLAEDHRFDAAYDAFEAGDWDAAAAAYQSLLAENPADPDAAAGLVRVELMRRTDGADPAAAIAASDADPANVDAATVAADFEILDGNARGAFNRLIEAIRATSGDDREKARQHLLRLFELVGPHDPDVNKARGALASALF